MYWESVFFLHIHILTKMYLLNRVNICVNAMLTIYFAVPMLFVCYMLVLSMISLYCSNGSCD